MKKFISRTRFSVSALLPVLLLSVNSQPLEAQEAEPSIYSCKQCVKYTGWRGNLDFGFGYVNKDSYRFGDYRGLEQEGLYLALDGDAHFRNLQGRYVDMYARNFGYDSREFDIRNGNRGVYELRFGWQAIPKYRGYGTQTPFLGAGGDYLVLPDDWVKANTTSGMDALESSLNVAPLKTNRKIMDAGLTLHLGSAWSYRIDYQRQQKKGTRTLGAGMFYTNSSILPAPVDFTTDLLDMDLTWSNKRAQLTLGFISSKFDNSNSSLTWQNPFRSSPQHSSFRAALEPGNEFYQFSLAGAYAFTPQIRLSGKAVIGELTQDDPFLPYTINPIYSDLPLPRSSLDGRVDASTYNLTGKLYTRISSKLSFTARGKWDERDNKTPVDAYTPVVTDLVVTAPRYNRPFSYKREQYSADLRYRAHRVIRLSGGLRQYNMDRTLQAVERTEETTWWGEAKFNPGFTSELRFKYESANRDIDDYLQPEDGGPVDHPLMRKFNMADRDADRVLIQADFMLTEKFGFNLGYIKAEADYENSELGLQNSDTESYSVDLNYAINDKVNLYAFYNLDYIDADMSNSTGGSATPWEAVTKDRIETYGLGLSATISEKSSIGFDYVSSDSKGDISVQTSNEEDPFDSLVTDLSNFKFYFDYAFNDRWGYKLYAEQEEYESSDWAIDGMGVDGINSVLSMGEQSPDYKVWYYRFQLSYRF
jgi:MtrB/PioB family decaheme-associated outer membrane protein